MAVLNKHGHKRTANEFAKELVMALGDLAFDWPDHINWAYYDQFTGKQSDAVDARVRVQHARVAAFLGNPDAQRVKGED